MRDAYEAGLEKLYPGNTLQDVDSAISGVYRKNGMEPAVYGGHQIGCGVNEKPRITCFGQDVIEPDMVVCMEPQNYLNGAGQSGVRLEKVIHVTPGRPC